MPKMLPKRSDEPPRELRGPLRELASIVPASEVNDNEVCAPPRVGERQLFEIPPFVWRTMVACYGLFLAALLGSTGGAHASFAIAISLFFVIMFFGTARAVLRQAPKQLPSALGRTGGVLQTAFGPLSTREVAAQVLVVPGVVALFAIAIATISIIST